MLQPPHAALTLLLALFSGWVNPYGQDSHPPLDPTLRAGSLAGFRPDPEHPHALASSTGLHHRLRRRGTPPPQRVPRRREPNPPIEAPEACPLDDADRSTLARIAKNVGLDALRAPRDHRQARDHSRVASPPHREEVSRISRPRAHHARPSRLAPTLTERYCRELGPRSFPMDELLETQYQRYVDEGDAVALERLVIRCRPVLLRLARRLGHVPEDSEDLVQETLITAFERAHRYDRSRPLLPWLKGILTHRAATLARSSRRRAAHIRVQSALLEPVSEGEDASIGTQQVDPSAIAATGGTRRAAPGVPGRDAGQVRVASRAASSQRHGSD